MQTTTSEPTLLSVADEVRLAVAIEAGVLARAAREAGRPVAARDEELAQLQAEGERAWRRFIAANLGLVRLVTAKEAQRCALPWDELFQEGCLGLMRAVQKFDHRRGCRFATYALRWIRAMVSAASSRRCGEVNLPVWRAEALRRARGTQVELSVQLGRAATAQEVAGVLHRDPVWVAELLAHQPSASLEQCCEAGLQVEDPAGSATVEQVVGRDEPALSERLDALPRLERQVIGWRFGFADGEAHTRVDVARRLRIGVTRCRDLELEALRRLRVQLDEAEGAAPLLGHAA